MSSFTSTQTEVEALYVGYFMRAGDPGGAQYWINQIQTGALNLAEAAASFSVQLETLGDYPFLATGTLGAPVTELGVSTYTNVYNFINQVYEDLFNRTVDAGGLAYWSAQLVANLGNPQAIGDFIINVISGAATGGADDLTLQAKVAVATFITNSAHSDGLTWSSALQTESENLIAATTSASGSAATEEAAWTSYISSSFPTTITLTTGIDTNASLGSPGAFGPTDVVVGTLASDGYMFNTNTLTPGDTLVFNGGTLQITDAGGDLSNTNGGYNALAGVNITGPFNFVDISATSNDAYWNFASTPSVTSVTVMNAQAFGAFENLPTGALFTVSGAATASTEFYYNYASAAAPVSIGVNGGVNGVTIYNYDSYGTAVDAATTGTISSTGAANGFVSPDAFELTYDGDEGTITSLTINAATNLRASLAYYDFNYSAGPALNVSGAATLVDLTGGSTTGAGGFYQYSPFVSVDASGLTAGALIMYADDYLTTFKGGGGGGTELLYDYNSSYHLDTVLSSAATSIDGGGGTGNVLSAQLVNAVNGGIFTDWQILDVTNLLNTTGLSLDASLMTNDSITGVQFSGSDTSVDTVLNIAPAATVLVTGGTGTDVFDAGLTLTHSSATGDSLAITFNNTDTTGSYKLGLGTLTSTGDATISIASNGGGSENYLEQLNVTDHHLTTVTITGSDYLVLGEGTGTINTGGVNTDTGTTTASDFTSSLTKIDGSATTGGVEILAGNISNDASGDYVLYTGLTILGGSGAGDYIYNGANAGVSMDGNGNGDEIDLGGSGATATFGTGAGDYSYVGINDYLTTANPAYNEAAGAALGDTVTFGAGATAELLVWTGAEWDGTTYVGSNVNNGVGETTVVGAVAATGTTPGTLIDFAEVIGSTTNIVNEQASVASATTLTAAENDAVNAFSVTAAKGVAYFTYGANEYLVGVATAAETAVSAGDAVVELSLVSIVGLSMASGIVHLV